MEADDLMAAVFPALAACQENTPGGPVVIPDHVIVRQTLLDCLHEAMDVDGLVALLQRMEAGSVRVHFVESTEPSVLSHEILNGKPYTFLDDAPLEERRTRAVALRRGLPLHAEALGRLDPDALGRVRGEAAPDVRGPEELHDLLLSTVVWRPQDDYEAWFGALAASGRAVRATLGDGAGVDLWCAVERRRWVEAAFPAPVFEPDAVTGAMTAAEVPDADVVAAEAIRGHLEVTGPVTVSELAARTGLAATRVKVGLGRLEAEGFAMRGSFDAGAPDEQWCSRRLLARIHAYTQHRLRREIEPVTAQEFVRFLLQWQHAAPGSQRQGRAGVLAVIDQLQGFEIPAGAWEEAVLPSRVEGYQHRWLEDLCHSGELVWGRLSPRPVDAEGTTRRGSATPSRATPVTFALREDLPWLLRAARGDVVPAEPVHGAAREVLDALRARGAMFHSELRSATGRLPVEVEEGLWDLVARGIVTADGFQAVRSLLSARQAWKRRQRHEQRLRTGVRRSPTWREGGEGRWALLPTGGPDEEPDRETLADQVAGQLLARWGVVFWDLMARENLALPWREVVWALRRLEARGIVRGGRFVTGPAGEQYALPEAVEELRRVRRTQRAGQTVRLNAADPLNLAGIILPGPRVTAVRTNSITYRDGLAVSDEDVSA
jgi:ATP-dependent Lhr-like helicase